MNATDHDTSGAGRYEASPQERAAWQLRTTIREIAGDVFASALTETRVKGYQVLTRPGLDDPLAGLRAAMLARDVAIGQMREYAETARGAGRTWDEIGAVLGIDQDRDGPSGELAFGLLIEDRALSRESHGWWQEPSAHWTCHGCGQRVIDRGLFGSHPDDTESGHAAGCARHAAAIAACQAGWDDNTDDVDERDYRDEEGDR